MSGNPFGAFIRHQRRAAGLTREQLASRVNLSVSLIEKIEQGTRPTTLANLRILFDGLNVPPLQRRHILNLSLPGMLTTDDAPTPVPTPADLDDLESLGHPAGFFLIPAFTAVAVNLAFEHAFPGTGPGTNLIEWILLNPAAPAVVPQWRQEAHRLVCAFRTLTPDPSTDVHTLELIENCGKSPEWERMWATTIPEADQFRDRILVRDPADNEVHPLLVRLYSPEFPDRPWWLLRLIPACRSQPEASE
ncbi:helix-turn-helix domain-containing protein [Nocardia sp. NPDC003693]